MTHIPPQTQERLLALLDAACPHDTPLHDDLWRLMATWCRQRIDPEKDLSDEVGTALAALEAEVRGVAHRVAMGR